MRLDYPRRWQLHLAPVQPQRLVVFVHGFGGRPTKTWNDFSEIHDDDWWRRADLLFVGWSSVMRDVTTIANLLSSELPSFFPKLPHELTRVGGIELRPSATHYDDLFLVGHSLGGVVLRKFMLDEVQDWDSTRTEGELAPAVLNAHLRLFSPASAGFSPTGFLGLVHSIHSIREIGELMLAVSPNFQTLKIDSPRLRELRDETVKYVDRGYTELRARILWAGKDHVVEPRRYPSDHREYSQQDHTHGSVCKPNLDYRAPWTFVERGRP